MEVTGADITFSLQHGLVRDITTVNASQLTLKTLKDRACEFINTKVSHESTSLSYLPRPGPRDLGGSRLGTVRSIQTIEE